MENVLFQTSLIAAFIAGMVALFAPCCITFLLPAYLGSIFKEKEKILFMTLIFGLGIFVVLLPAVLGIQLISLLFFRYHDTVYYLGALLMLFVAFISLLGLKLPMINIPGAKPTGKTDVLSIFTLGIFSGVASACCAPVLMGILTFAFLSPNFFGAILVGAMYVLGMVVPLLFISLFLAQRIPKNPVFRNKLFEISLFGKTYPIIASNLIASIIFFATGLITLFLTFTGKLTMARSDEFAKIIQNAGNAVNQYVGDNTFVNILFLGVVMFVIYKIARRV